MAGDRSTMTGRRPVIAYVTATLPWPPTSGGRIRIATNLEALAAVGPVHMIAFPSGRAEADPPPDDLLASLHVHPIARPSQTRRIVDRATSLVRLEHSYATRWRRAGGLDLLVEGVGAARASVVFLEWPFYPAAIDALRKVAPVVAADIVDDRVASILGIVRYGPGLTTRLRALLDLPGLVRGEGGIGQLDQAWFARSSDARRFGERHRRLDVRAIPNVVDEVHLAAVAAGSGPPRSRSAAFLGSFAHAPNEVAGLRFALGVAPILHRAAPDATLAIIGRLPTPAIRRAAARTGVELLADVPDAAAVLRRFAVLVAPLSSGQGSNVKILEALALRVPVVTTPVALAGLDLVDGVHVLVARSDDALARAVLRLWEDPALSARLAEAGAALVRDRYGRAALRRLVAEAILEVTERV